MSAPEQPVTHGAHEPQAAFWAGPRDGLKIELPRYLIRKEDGAPVEHWGGGYELLAVARHLDSFEICRATYAWRADR